MNNLLDAAKRAREKAYAPYSNYLVGAAILTAKGNIYAGCNVENAVYPLGNCAERVAIQNMVSAGEREMAALLLLTENRATPCGACRQVISEFAKADVIIYIANPDAVISQTTIGELLPSAFKLK
jgi:cytidine deaminase